MRSLFALLLAALVGIVFAPKSALAAQSARAEKTTLQEVDGRWRLKLTIDYGSIPDIAFIPMIFDFEPVTYYERALTDESPEKPVLNKKQLQNMKHINESMEVGFSDGTGKAFKVTKFDFAIRRDRGFEAGEYKLIIKIADTGKQVGQPIRLTLEGDNPIVDRRAISFVGEKAGGEKKDKPKSKHADTDVAKSDEPTGDPAPSSDGAPADAEPPPAVEPKSGGCGCEMPGASAPAPFAALGIALVGLVGLRRRRSRG
jgi:MYXO-CTERM domain-containing protein